MTRQHAIDNALAYFEDGRFHADLARRVGFRTESEEPRADQLGAYLEHEIGPSLARLGFRWRRVENPACAACPFLVAERREGGDLPTLLTYGHGDVTRGQDALWTKGRGPWELAAEGDYLYGRGTADNKGQHTINFGALAQVLDARGGRLGFNIKVLLDTGEEIWSPGLREIAEELREELAADVFIASDGPRLRVDRPMLYLGSRGVMSFDMSLTLREGGSLANPAIVLANAIASIVDGRGRLKVDGLRATAIESAVMQALAEINAEDGPEPGAAIDDRWGEPGLTPMERVFCASTFEVMRWEADNTPMPYSAIPSRALAHCQLRFVAGADWRELLSILGGHLDARGFGAIELALRATPMQSRRVAPDHPRVAWAIESVQRTTGRRPHILPNTRGSVPNDVFSDVLGLPTIWIPHSYGACLQHAPNEHLRASVAREALAIMTGLFWDLGEAAHTKLHKH